MKDKLIALGYKEYDCLELHKWTMQKRVDSDIVCDLNDKLFINITYNDLRSKFLEFEHIKNHFTIEVSGEKHNQWFYITSTIDEDKILDNIGITEERLINAFIAIHNIK